MRAFTSSEKLFCTVKARSQITSLSCLNSIASTVRLIVGLVLICLTNHALGDNEPLQSIPLGKGLPVVVHGSIFFHDISDIDENSETFKATIDFRLIWSDPRLKYPSNEGLHGYKEYRFNKAEEKLATMWSPRIRYLNRVSTPQHTDKRVRIFPDGKVEVTMRSHAEYRSSIDLGKFPFDRQKLIISVAIEEDTLEVVDLQLDGTDMDYSGASENIDLAGWQLGIVNLTRDELRGWNGDRYATLQASVGVKRDPMTTVSTIFIPLLASLLIPLLATWLNRMENGHFTVDSFELVNLVIGGLFATIALAFTINSSMPTLSVSDNSVTHLLGLNYACLAFGFFITVALYRFELPKRYFGRFVQEAIFEFIVWAFPAIMLTLSATFILVAMC